MSTEAEGGQGAVREVVDCFFQPVALNVFISNRHIVATFSIPGLSSIQTQQKQRMRSSFKAEQ